MKLLNTFQQSVNQSHLNNFRDKLPPLPSRYIAEIEVYLQIRKK